MSQEKLQTMSMHYFWEVKEELPQPSDYDLKSVASKLSRSDENDPFSMFSGS